jgi:peptidoglycan/xylan/chitin deacetylase (PgdA/CDA1 family)
MIVRSLPKREQEIFLTFDDGPDEVSTPRVLDVLASRGVRATFFVISQKAKRQSGLLNRMRHEGHAIGSHSADHAYHNFFRRGESLRRWVQGAERDLARLGIAPTAGFRPPAGIVTPPLRLLTEEIGLPLVLWNERFYDAVWPWTPSRARTSAARLAGGSIVLLHDRQSPRRLASFCRTLAEYIDLLEKRGFRFSSLEGLR